MFFAGQTDIFGNVISSMGSVSIDVDTGLSAQLLNAELIRNPATVNPDTTVRIQNSLSISEFQSNRNRSGKKKNG